MASGKRQARKRQREAFLSSVPDLGDAWERGRRAQDELDERRDAAIQRKACTSKQRYATAGEARDAIASCAAHGRGGLSSYRCPYCRGYHLTSHPRPKTKERP